MNRLLQHIAKHVTSDHLDNVGMSYVEHMRFSLSLGNQFMYNATTAYIHAVCPAFFSDSSSKGLVSIQKRMNDKRDELLLKRHHARIDAQHQLLKRPSPRPLRPPFVSPQYPFPEYRFDKTFDSYSQEPGCNQFRD